MPHNINTNSTKKALILLSGGQDSTTCLAWAKKKFTKIYAITFDYGQRHKIELKSAKIIAKITNIPLKIQKINLFKEFSKNALTHNLKITEVRNIHNAKKNNILSTVKFEKTISNSKNKKSTLPSTFVPGRNLIFLSIAAIYAKQLNITDIITGVCETDYSGYPDCRNEFIKSLQKTLCLAMDHPFKIITPLMNLTKAETVKLMKRLNEIELLKYTYTCYNGGRIACGTCPACKLRLRGFKQAKIKDPIEYPNSKLQPIKIN